MHAPCARINRHARYRSTPRLIRNRTAARLRRGSLASSPQKATTTTRGKARRRRKTVFSRFPRTPAMPVNPKSARYDCDDEEAMAQFSMYNTPIRMRGAIMCRARLRGPERHTCASREAAPRAPPPSFLPYCAQPHLSFSPPRSTSLPTQDIVLQPERIRQNHHPSVCET